MVMSLRRFRWLELAYQESYFVRTMMRFGWVVMERFKKDNCIESPVRVKEYIELALNRLNIETDGRHPVTNQVDEIRLDIHRCHPARCARAKSCIAPTASKLQHAGLGPEVSSLKQETNTHQGIAYGLRAACVIGKWAAHRLTHFEMASFIRCVVACDAGESTIEAHLLVSES